MESNYVESLYKQIEQDLGVKATQISAVLKLLEEGSTVPFIARYRKEATGALDEEQIRAISKAYEYGVSLQTRKADVIRLIDEKGMLTPELETSIRAAQKLTEVEDLYRPYKEKKKTRATEAKRRGLEPFAAWLLSYPNGDVLNEAKKYITEEVQDAQAALDGAMDIIAEIVADDAKFRKWIREYIVKRGVLQAKVKDESLDERGVYKQYYDYEEPVAKVQSHRVLALNRAESEGVLRVSISEDNIAVTNYLKREFIQNNGGMAVDYIKQAIDDAYKRLIKPSIEREIRAELKTTAETGAIHIFSENLKQLLMQPPMKGRVVLGVDPAFRTGCKLAVVDATGKVLDIDVIYPHEASKGAAVDPKKLATARQKISDKIKAFDVKIVSIGNGTASRETESFIADILKNIDADVHYIITNEAGASVYSASELAKKEFPDLKVEERSAVSIARRLQDPLAELVKIDPKSIGVGQYQHDVSQRELNDSLQFVVETTVNQVGVNLNTASAPLLSYVAGVSGSIASNIVAYRDEIGKFTNRKQLKKVKRLGDKTYEQAIGFLRILEPENPLDKTPIHPESYSFAEKIVSMIGCTIDDLGTENMISAVGDGDANDISSELGIDLYTVTDILEALASPNRDLRDSIAAPLLKKDVLKLEDLKVGMELAGTVRNIVDFGAFVDCGVKEAGLVHLSQMRRAFVKHPLDVVSVGDIVTVWVKDVDLKRGRIALTMLSPKG